MKLSDFLAAAQYRISDSSTYGWECYGPNAQFLDAGDHERDDQCSCIFDRKTQQVYEVTINHPTQPKVWWDPDYRVNYFTESLKRKQEPFKAWDDVKYKEVHSESSILNDVNDVLSKIEDKEDREFMNGQGVNTNGAPAEEAFGPSIEELEKRFGDNADPSGAWVFPYVNRSKTEDEEIFDDWEADLERENAEVFKDVPGEEYTVKIEVAASVTVKARTMDDAAQKVRTWYLEERMGPAKWLEHSTFNDEYVIKVTVEEDCA